MARLIALGLGTAVAYLVAARVGFQLAFVAEQITTVWAPTGISIAALLLGGLRLWPAIWIGAFGANITTEAPSWTAFAIATGNTLEAVFAVLALRRVPRFDPSFSRVADGVAFLALAAGAATTISATIGVATLCAASVQPWARFGTLWFDWWLGDGLGALIVAPAILTTVRHPWTLRSGGTAVAYAAGSLLLTYIVFADLLGLGGHPLEFVVFPVAIAAAVIGGPPLSSLVVLATSLAAIWPTATGTGPFAGADVHRSLVLLQVFMGVLAGTAMLLAAAVAERRTAVQQATEAADAVRVREELLRLAQRAGGVAVFEWDFRNQVARCSAEFFRIFGLPPFDGVISGAEWHRFVHPDDREMMATHLGRALEGMEPPAADYRIIAADGSTRWLSYAGRVQQTPDGDRMVGTVVDITDRKRLESDLRRRIVEQRTLLDVLPIGIGIATDPECRHISTNRAFAAALGLAPDANASKTAAPDERPTNFRVLTPQGDEIPDTELPLQVAAREGNEIRDREVDVVHEDGRVVRLLMYAAPILDEHGLPRGSIGAFVDVTAAHSARERLARSEERYRRIFDTAEVAILEGDFSSARTATEALVARTGQDVVAYLDAHPEFVDECIASVRITDANHGTIRMFGAADKSELLASLGRVFGSAAPELFRGGLTALARGDRRYEAEAQVRRLDGTPLHLLVCIACPPPGDTFQSVLVSLVDITARKAAETALQQEVEVRTALARVGASLAGELRTDALVQSITDVATKLTEAEFGAFFYNVTNEHGDSYALYALSGAPIEAFSRFPHPRATAIFGPTFRGEAAIRLDDVTRDPRYGRNSPYHGMPPGHLPVRSYLAVPVVGRGGAVLGGLFFGHSTAGTFKDRHEQLAAGVASWAAIALDNAALYRHVEEANRLKDEFLATLSHELRTPLNAVLGWVHMLREGSLQPSMRERALESLERNAKAQAQLVEDLLDVSRIMSGKLQIQNDAVDLARVVLNAVDTVRAGATAKRLDLRTHVPSGHRIMVTGDADRLQQVVWNLVSNAIKFTPAGGEIDVELRAMDSAAEIVVRDTGQGIAPSFQPHLFERFRQMDGSMTRRHGGLGLGLSIVRHVAEAHGGTVTAESAGEGHGATFRVLLPLRAIETIAADAAASIPSSVEPVLTGVRALVVDDDPDGREYARYLLVSRGADVETAGSTGEALRILSVRRFDVLVADLAMPEQDGLDLIRAVRDLPAGSLNVAVPAIALTAYAGVRERDGALSAGFQWHLSKPVEPEQLIAAVSTAVERVGR